MAPAGLRAHELASPLDPVALIVPPGDVYYGDLLAKRAQAYSVPETAWTYSRFDGLWASVGFCVMFLAIRASWNWSFNVLFRRKAR
jgi:hypothetical protein